MPRRGDTKARNPIALLLCAAVFAGCASGSATVLQVPSDDERVAAEAAGFESVWTGEHVVLPDPQVPPSPAPPQERMLDPAVALAWVAAHTERLRLGTGIIILPQRNPLVLAKELASVDVVSGGRLTFGLGAGYLKPEFDAKFMHVPQEHLRDQTLHQHHRRADVQIADGLHDGVHVARRSGDDHAIADRLRDGRHL